MATRSRIGIELSDGSILSAYHHWDGYPEWLGRILKTHYNSYEKASELIEGGDMSSCWTDESWTRNMDGLTSVKATIKGPLYYSERGEDCPPLHDKNLKEYLSDGEEYAYLYTNNEWICYDMHEREPELVEIPAGALAV